MANEVLITASLAVTDAPSPTKALQITDINDTVTNHQQEFTKILVAITATAIPVSLLTSPGWVLFINRDDTHFIDLFTDNSAGKKCFGRLLPGLLCLIYLGTDAKAPYALADTAPCELEYLVCDA